MPTQFMVLPLPAKTVLETYFGKAFMCLSVRSLDILSARNTWREILNVPSIIVSAFKDTKITELSIFCPM